MKVSISKRIFGSLFEIRKGEYAKTILMFLYIFFLLSSYYIIKPVRNSLFLTKFDADSLPYVWILVAVIVGGIAYLYSRFLRRISLNVLISWTFAALLSNLVIFRWLFTFDWSWMAYVFYIWVSMFSILVTSQFWLLAINIFNPREGKRLFGFIGTGAVVGAAFGGTLTSLMVKTFGTDNMLYFCIAILAMAWGVYTIVWRLVREKPVRTQQDTAVDETTEGEEGIFGLIAKSRHLLLLVGIVGLILICSNFVDFQFNKIVQRSFESKDALTAFFGRFFLSLNIVAFTLQFFFTTTILRKFGIGPTILFLPVSLVVGAGAMIFAPILASAIFIKISEGGFRYSINRSGLELLYLPVPSRVKNKTKGFIDMFVDRFTRGISGGLLLLFTSVLSLNLRAISAILMLFAFALIFLATLIKREYVNSLRKAIYKGHLRIDETALNLNDATSTGVVLETLETGNVRQISYALSLLQDTDLSQILPSLEKLLSHPSEEVRARVLDMLHRAEYVELRPKVEELLDDDSPKVQVKALRYLAHLGETDQYQRLASLLTREDCVKRAVAVAYLAKHGKEEERKLLTKACVQEILSHRTELADKAIEELVEGLGYLDSDSKLIEFLPDFIEDKCLDVTIQAIRSMGRLKKRKHVLLLIRKLTSPKMRNVAREALANYGDRVLGTLRDIVCDEEEPIGIRTEIPKVMLSIGTQEAVDNLVKNLREKDLSLRFQIIKALDKLHDKSPDYVYDEEGISEAITGEAREYFDTFIVLSSLGAKKESGLLWVTIQEQLEKCYERISRLTALLYPAKDLLNIYHGLKSLDKVKRANSLELLDSILHGRHKKYILPIVEDTSVESKIRKGIELFGLKKLTGDEILHSLLTEGGRWLRACAIHTVGELRLTSFTKELEDALDSSDNLIRQTASYALGLISRGDIAAKKKEKGMTGIEKVIYLRGVDILAEVATEKLLLVGSVMTEKSYKKGEVLYSKGDYVDSMYLIVSGKVRYKEANLELEEKEAVGGAELFTGEPRPATAIVTEDAHLLKLDKEIFYDLLDDYMEIARDIFKALAIRIKQLHELSLKSKA